ncbi:thiol peroxidase [Cetobacterium somerae]|uniref:thiol peroxidase n=1 Tax=Cetobacterium somerae TaxID=188913 RepID=UPI00225AADF2|nr:thiol peroxidase [Cetobacterium somerae]MCX3068630.1 thiol peroxidase [Cetobacterium somerae]
MNTVYLDGNPVNIIGKFPLPNDKVKEFSLVDKDLNNVFLNNFDRKRKILNIFPSLDTPTCALSVSKFNQKALGIDNLVVLCISADLPFAQSRFCDTENTNNIITLSTMRSKSFLFDYGVEISDGPLLGLAARAVIVLNEDDRVIYSELVSDIKKEPDYVAAIASLK